MNRGAFFSVAFWLLPGAVEPAVVPMAQETAPLAASSPNHRLLVGEKMEFEVRWNPPGWLFFLPPMTAGTITMEVQKETQSSDHSEYRISAHALSSGTLSKLAGVKVHNVYETILDPVTLCPRQFRMVRREGRIMQDVQIDFDSSQRRLHIQKWDAARNPPRETKNETIEGIPECIQDLVSIFYGIRKLPMEAGKVLEIALSNDDGKAGNIQLHIENSPPVKSSIGSIPAFAIRAKGLFGGAFRSGGEFQTWIDRDRKIPLKFEARVRLGKISGTITRFKPGGGEAATSGVESQANRAPSQR